MFIGRNKELEELNKLYKENGFKMAVISGLRGIGKSSLIKEFIKGKKSIYYRVAEFGMDRNLELLSEQVLLKMAPGIKNVSFVSVEDLFDFMTVNLSGDKLIFVLDELSYFIKKDENILDCLQKYIDNVWSDKNIMLILCSSDVNFMTDKFLNNKSLLSERTVLRITLDAFNYMETAEFVPGYSFEDKAICYGITGGVAKYLSMIDSDIDIHENIKKLFFDTSGYLYEETQNILSREFSDITLVNNILEQVASGKNTLNIISEKLHEKDATVLYSIKKLINMGILKKRLCITEEDNRKKVKYVFNDLIFNFWYQFIPGAYSMIEQKKGYEYYDKIVRFKINDFMDEIFERICEDFLRINRKVDKYDCCISETGTWWGMENINDKGRNKRVQPVKIDIIALSDIKETVFVCECEFKNEKMDKNAYETLVRRSGKIKTQYKNIKYMFFSAAGFSDSLKKAAKCDVYMFDLNDIYKQ